MSSALLRGFAAVQQSLVGAAGARWAMGQQLQGAAALGRCLLSSSATSGDAAGAPQQRWAGAAAAAAAGGIAISLAAQHHQTPAQAEAPPAAAPTPAVDAYKRPTTVQGLPPSFTLYQYEVCPYCCKLKAVLDYYKLPYHVVEVNPLTKGELSWSTYRKVPILKWDDASGHVERDSSVIISKLAAELAVPAGKGPGGRPAGAPKVVPAPTGKALEEEEKWRRWVDDRFVKVITANIYRNWDESVDTFKYITSMTNWSWGTREAARWAGAVLMWQIGKRMPSKYGLEGDLRDVLYADCNAWVEVVGPKRPFLGGAQPGLADLSVFGVLRAIDHTNTFRDAMANTKIKPWYDRMVAAVGPSARLPAA